MILILNYDGEVFLIGRYEGLDNVVVVPFEGNGRSERDALDCIAIEGKIK